MLYLTCSSLPFTAVLLLDNPKESSRLDLPMVLIPEIRKWFSFNGIKAVGEPSKIKRPWLSIIKHLIKSKIFLKNKILHFCLRSESNKLILQIMMI